MTIKVGVLPQREVSQKPVSLKPLLLLTNWISRLQVLIFEMQSKAITVWFVLACPIANAQVEHPSHRKHHELNESHDNELVTSVFWDSKYVSEGRDNLEDGGLGSVALDWTPSLELDGELTFAGWYAEGTSVDYTELNLGVAYEWNLEEIGISAGYTWLDFAEDNESDSEFSLELGRTLYSDIDFQTAFIYSTEAGGTFIEVVLSKSFDQEKLSWSPYLLLGVNEGYVSDELKGVNHLQLGLEATVPLSDHLELGGYIAYTMDLKREPGQTLDDIFWLGMNLGWRN